MIAFVFSILDSVETVEQLKGLTLVPKRALDVMKCEVNRLLVLGQHSIIPVPYIVPRKVKIWFCQIVFHMLIGLCMSNTECSLC